MSVDVAIVRNRVTETLNACSAGTFASTIDANNFQRNASAITEAVTEAGLMIGRAILANPNHVHRNIFVSSATSLTHGAELPDMAGEMSLVEIETYSGATWKTGVKRDVQEIESYRENPESLYDSIDHDTQGSRLSGYYATSNGRFYFTGNDARGYFPILDNSTINTLIPEEYQSVWVGLSIGLTIKEGDNLMPIAQYYLNYGLSELPAISAMGVIRPMPTVERARQERGNV